MPGRTADVRPPNPSELRATSVLALTIDEASAKVRTGGPVDDEDDLALPIWAGQIPLAPRYGSPISEPDPGAPVPSYVVGYHRP